MSNGDHVLALGDREIAMVSFFYTDLCMFAWYDGFEWSRRSFGLYL